jgi:HlyD family secretion protein
MKKSILIILSIAVVGGLGYYFYNRNKSTTLPNWKTVRVEQGNLVQYVTATGSVAADTTVQVGTQVSGIIAKILVDFNSVVKFGQIVAVLDTTFLYASKEDASATLQKAVVQSEEMKREFDRAKTLFDQKVADQADYDLAIYNYESARSAQRSAKAQYDRAVINLQYATIKAPVSGTVISRNVDVGQTVISSFNAPTLFSIANDLTKMQVQASVDEADIGQVREQQEAEFTVDAYPDDLFHGKVKQIRLQPVMVQNVVNYTVIIEVPNKDRRLMPGLTANIRIKVNEHDSVLKIPVNALHFSPPPDYPGNVRIPDSILHKSESLTAPVAEEAQKKSFVVWVKLGPYIYPVRVKTGISDGILTEVTGNLRPGSEVAVGILAQAVVVSKQQSPFMPKFQPARKSR